LAVRYPTVYYEKTVTRLEEQPSADLYPPRSEFIIEATLTFPAPALKARRVVGDETFSWCPVVSCASQSTWHALFTASLSSDEAVSPDQVIAEVTFPAERAWYLNSGRDLVSLIDEVFPPWPVGCLAVLKHGDGLFQVNFDPEAHFRLRHSGGSLIVGVTLRDRRACGLRLWGEHKLAKSPSKHSLRIVVSRLANLSEAIWAEPYPGSARSVVCLTDHADWDSVPKAAALCDLFAAHDLRITKGVFPAADPGCNYGPGLDSPEYAAIIDRWFQTGHEIAFHGLGSAINAPAHLDECLRRIDRLDSYAPQTWIDHSCGEYTVARSARLPGHASLLQILAAKGVRNLWSYADVWENPGTHLHIWHPRSPLSAFRDFLRLARRSGPVSPLRLAYLCTIPLKNLTGDAQYRRVLRRPTSLSGWVGLATNYRRLCEIRRHPLCLYGLGGDFFLQDPEGTMVFDTILLNHVTLQLCPPNIERLARDNGILIAHTYLAAVHKKGGNNCFRVDRGAQLLDGFRENVEHISSLQKRGEVVTLPLRDLREALVRHAQTIVIRTAEGWEVRGDVLVSSHTPYRIAGENMTKDHHGVFTAAIPGAAFLANP